MTLQAFIRLSWAATFSGLCLAMAGSAVAQSRLVEIEKVRADPVAYFTEPRGALAGTIPRSAFHSGQLEIFDQHENRRFLAEVEGYGRVWLDPRQVQLDEERTRRVLCDRLASGTLGHGVRMVSQFNCAR